jgi:hypothetical protein
MSGNSFDQVKLGVGLIDSQSYGYTLLEQSGIPRYIIKSIDDGINSGLRIFFWNHEPESLLQTIGKHTNVSIALLTTHNYIGKLFNNPVGLDLSFSFSANQIYEFNGGEFYLNQNIFTYPGADIGIAYSRNHDKIQNSGIFIYQHENVLLISFPWDFLNFRMGSEFAFRPFYSDLLQKNFVEIGPPVDLAKFRKLVIENLIFASDKLKLPLICQQNPFQNGKYFSVRIDADGFRRDAIADVLKVSDHTGLNFTWFIDVGGWKGNLEMLKILKDHQQTVQFHCYTHMTYKSSVLNKINIKKGLNSMKKYSVYPDAIVSPNGFYPAGFAEAVKGFGFKYSSEFGYDVDDLPSWPQNDKDQPLQLPVHPGSFGVFLPAGFTNKNVFEHLLQNIQTRISSDGLAILYEHPYYFQNRSGMWIDFLNGLLNEGYTYLSLEDISTVWKDYVGQSVKLTYSFQKNEILTDIIKFIPNLVQLNKVKSSGNINIRENIKVSNPCNFLLIDSEAVQKEIESRQWILNKSSISIPKWFCNYYWLSFKVLAIKWLRKTNFYNKKN